jgi:hypothetical protein
MKNGNVCGQPTIAINEQNYVNGMTLTGPTSDIAWVLAFSETTMR